MFISETWANIPITVYHFQPYFDNLVNPREEVTWQNSPEISINYPSVLGNNSSPIWLKMVRNFGQDVFSLLQYFVPFLFSFIYPALK